MKLVSENAKQENYMAIARRFSLVSVIAIGVVAAVPFTPILSKGSVAQAQEEEAAPRAKEARASSLFAKST